jgi:aminocarboxymuconate-semialdehyde decarboxylase
MPIIDMHTHTVSKRVEPVVTGQYDPMEDPYRRDMSRESRTTDAEQGKLLPRLMLDVAVRREAMQRMGSIFRSCPGAGAAALLGR